LLDAHIGYELDILNQPVKLFLNANNILNYNYVELIGNLQPIRNFSLSAELTF
jgi:outer membrane receptor protein involved in Fe transport